MLFQAPHSLYDKEFQFTRGSAISFPLHIHRSFEYFAQLQGQTELIIDGQTLLLTAGQAVLIFPFQSHAYKAVEDGAYALGFFSPEIVPEFYTQRKHLLPENNRFSYLCEAENADNLFLQKATAYRICGEFDRQRTYLPQSKDLHPDIILKLLLYVDDHFAGNCNLGDAAAAIGYDYAYISKYFKRKTGISFSRYVNMVRINRSKHLLLSTEKPLARIAEECGFSGCRTFHREFNRSVGLTPSQYRKQ